MNKKCKHNAPPIIKEDGIYCRLCGKKLESLRVAKAWAKVERFMNQREETE